MFGWYGHVKTDEARVNNKIMELLGNRLRGRPRRKGIYCVKDRMRQRGVNTNEASGGS